MGYNLFQLLVHGRLYIWLGQRPHYWAYWPTDTINVIGYGLLTLWIFTVGACLLAVALVYPLLILLWGKSVPGHTKLPPLDIKD